MKSKAAIQTAINKPLVVDEVEIPDPQPNQVIVKLLSSGVCHSQLHQMHRVEQDRPLVFGHEGTGIVTHVGKNVKHLKEGDFSIITWVPKTPIKGRLKRVLSGVTYRGKIVHNIVVQTWVEDALIESEYAIPIAKKHATDVSCIVGCAVLTGAGAVLNTARVRPNDSVAVFGVGGVGLSAIKMAALLGAFPVIAVDLHDDKLALAKDFGATHVVNASENDPVDSVIDISMGGVDFSFDAIGVKTTTEQILPVTRSGGPGADNHGGMAILIGIPGRKLNLDPQHFFMYQRQYRGSLGATYPDRDFPMFLRLHEEGKFPLDKLVTRRYRLDEINDACAALEAGEILGRAIIIF